MSLTRQQQLESDYMMHTYGRKPVQFVRGEGIYLFDDEGKRYLDFLAGIGAVSVGHCNPAVTAAITQQINQLVHVGNYFYIEGRGELAVKLDTLLSASETTDEGGWKVFFANSGAEANEGAIKLARKYGKEKLAGATTIVTAQKSFHGRTLASLAATGQEAKQAVFAPMPAGFVHVPLNDVAALKDVLDQQGNGGSGASGSGASSTGASGSGASSTGASGSGASSTDASSTAASGSGANNTDGAVCAVMLECIQGESGVWPCDESYLKAVRELTSERGILLMIDEVQTGFFRTGTYPFAYQHAGIVPDVVSMAKGIANGVPIGAFAARGSLGDLLKPGEHGSTFGGSPLAIAAANATIDELIRISAATNVTQIGDYFAGKLACLPKVNEVRGKGLMRAVQLTEPIAVAVVDAALACGLIINAIGDSTLRFLPPLVVSHEHIDEALAILESILAKETI